jgi:geranylgeranylglycerol-phosphate geranylgeranyltransferase
MSPGSVKIRGLLRLFRFELPFTAGVCVVLGEILALGSIPGIVPIAVGFISIFCISATALILNDYFDYETDRINAPDRPLPSGAVTKREALVLSIVVAGLGILTSAFISLIAFVVAIVVWLVGLAYNWRVKRYGLFGNILVAFSVGMTFVYGGIVVGRPFDGMVIWFGVLAMLFDLAEEIAADALDAEGDRVIGSRSVAIVHGPRVALLLSAGMFALVVGVSLVPFIAGWLEPVYLIPIGLMDANIVYSVARLLSPQVKQPRVHVRAIYLGGSLAIVLFILMRVLLT